MSICVPIGWNQSRFVAIGFKTNSELLLYPTYLSGARRKGPSNVRVTVTSGVSFRIITQSAGRRSDRIKPISVCRHWIETNPELKQILQKSAIQFDRTTFVLGWNIYMKTSHSRTEHQLSDQIWKILFINTLRICSRYIRMSKLQPVKLNATDNGETAFEREHRSKLINLLNAISKFSKQALYSFYLQKVR